MPLTFESVLDRTTSLGPVSNSPKRGEDREERDPKKNSPPPDLEQADAVIGMTDETRQLRQAMRNTNAGITLLQIAEGSLQEIRTIFTNMRLLVEQATTPLREGERHFFQTKLDRLTQNINDIANKTAFDDIEILNGSSEQLVIQIENGEVSERFELNLPDMRTTALGIDIGNIDVRTSPSSARAIPIIDQALEPIQSHQKRLGHMLSQLEEVFHELESQLDEAKTQGPQIRGAELAIRTAKVMREFISAEQTSAIAGQIDSIHQDAKHLVS